MGMQPWVNDFKYRVIGWHYDFYMRDQSRRAINSNQHAAEDTQLHYDSQIPETEIQTRKGISEQDKRLLSEMDSKGIRFSDQFDE